MTAGKRTTTSAPGTVTVTVTPGTAVYFNSEQQGGTIDGVPAEIAADWQRHGWATTE